MKKFSAISMLSVLALSFGAPDFVVAEEASRVKAERAEHYEAAIETTEEAFLALDEKIADIARLMNKKDVLDFLELESIHEMSYTLEAAVDKLRAEKAVDKAKLDVLDEAVQAIHYSSEKQEELKTREWFAKLEPAANDIRNSPETAVVHEKKEFYEIVIKDHKFSPAEMTVPAGQKIKLIVYNRDKTPEEFESHDFNREKIIAGNSKAIIFVGPLKPGKYYYFGEFNEDSAKGYIIAE